MSSRVTVAGLLGSLLVATAAQAQATNERTSESARRRRSPRHRPRDQTLPASSK